MGVGTSYTSDIFLEIDRWYHIAAVWKSDGTAVMYVDGVVSLFMCLINGDILIAQ